VVKRRFSALVTVLVVVGCNEVAGIEPAMLEDESRTEPTSEPSSSPAPVEGPLDGSVLEPEPAAPRTCKPGFVDCNEDPTDGCETDLSRAETCGACNAHCPATAPVCVPASRGAFQCATGCTNEAPTLCGTTCSDLAVDPLHCGSCTKECPTIANAHATCVDSVCGTACNEGAHRCGANCVSDRSPATCGTSCTACPTAAHANATCNGTSCGLACASGFANCDGTMTNGCEIDVKTNASHCGGCGKACAALQVCSNGKCV
jgi:hypothetical protein